MDEDLFVLLEPSVERSPLEVHGSVQTLDLRVGEQPRSVRPVHLTEPQPVHLDPTTAALVGALSDEQSRRTSAIGM